MLEWYHWIIYLSIYIIVVNTNMCKLDCSMLIYWHAIVFWLFVTTISNYKKWIFFIVVATLFVEQNSKFFVIFVLPRVFNMGNLGKLFAKARINVVIWIHGKGSTQGYKTMYFYYSRPCSFEPKQHFIEYIMNFGHSLNGQYSTTWYLSTQLKNKKYFDTT